jgi:hypothetical protein
VTGCRYPSAREHPNYHAISRYSVSCEKVDGIVRSVLVEARHRLTPKPLHERVNTRLLRCYLLATLANYCSYFASGFAGSVGTANTLRVLCHMSSEL